MTSLHIPDFKAFLESCEEECDGGECLLSAGELRALVAHIRAIQSALGTDETGEALVEVARNAHAAEQRLAAVEQELELRVDEQLREIGRD